VTRSRLEDQARTFAADLGDLLNGTVTDGTRISAVLHEPTSLCFAGRGVGKHDLRPQPIPLTLGRKPPTGYLLVAFTLEMDPEGVHLAVTKSGVALYATEAPGSMIFHYDYVRDPDNEYPSAHVQVAGQSEPLAMLLTRAGVEGRSLRDLHLPVGGRRFRPTVEDVVELLVVEGLARAREGWRDVVAEHRERWTVRQVKAAVRRYPQAAVDQLTADGYDVVAPPPGDE
jgi:hypothetical protein